MADKYSVLIKYKHLEYIENASLSNNDAWLLIKAIVEYDKNGVMPVFQNPVSTALFAIIKSDIDENREKWEGVVKSKSDAGKKGMEKRWAKNDITEDNKNNTDNTSYDVITSITPVISDIKNITPITKITDLDYDLDNESGGGNENGNGNGIKQPPLFLIKTKIKEQGFFLDDDRAIERLITGADPPWFEGRHSFIDFIAETVYQEYGDKPKREQHKVFRKLLFDAPNLRDEYPQWKTERENASQTATQNEIIKKARGSPPQKCQCGGELRREGDGDYFVCIVCKGFYRFDGNLFKWVFIDGAK